MSLEQRERLREIGLAMLNQPDVPSRIEYETVAADTVGGRVIRDQFGDYHVESKVYQSMPRGIMRIRIPQSGVEAMIADYAQKKAEEHQVEELLEVSESG